MASPSYKKYRLLKRVKITLLVIVAILLTIIAVKGISSFFVKKNVVEEACERGENVALIKIHGNIVTYKDNLDDKIVGASSEEILDYINQINNINKIKAIIIDIDSFGGSPVAGEEIANALRNSKKPTIALIRGAGDSAAYMASTGARKIYAAAFSEVGNIGITMSYLDYSQQNSSGGIAFQELSSGKFKDIANPNKSLTQDEKDLLIGYINQLNESFIDLVSKNRNLDRQKTVEVADGSIMTAQDAQTRGLIDEVGNIDDIISWLKAELKIKANICTIN